MPFTFEGVAFNVLSFCFKKRRKEENNLLKFLEVLYQLRT